MIRILISPTRSGSTALLRCFENNPHVDMVYHQPVKSGYRQNGEFDYSFFWLDEHDLARVFVAKETVGGFVRPEAEFMPIGDEYLGELFIGERFPGPHFIDKVRPLFLFRDPLQTWNSINRLNRLSDGLSPFFSPFEYFVISYRNVFEFLDYSREVTPHAYCLTIEQLGADPEWFLNALCHRWDLRYHSAMVKWELGYGDRTWYSEETKHRHDTDARFKLSKESVERSTEFGYTPSPLSDIHPEHLQIITRDLQPLYTRAQRWAKEDFPDRPTS